MLKYQLVLVGLAGNKKKKTNMEDFRKMDGGMSLTEQERQDYLTRMRDPFSMQIGDVWSVELDGEERPVALGRVWSGALNSKKVVIVDVEGNKVYATVRAVTLFNKVFRDIDGLPESGDACGIFLDDVDFEELKIGSTIHINKA